jgi:hypothetical protein
MMALTRLPRAARRSCRCRPPGWPARFPARWPRCSAAPCRPLLGRARRAAGGRLGVLAWRLAGREGLHALPDHSWNGGCCQPARLPRCHRLTVNNTAGPTKGPAVASSVPVTLMCRGGGPVRLVLAHVRDHQRMGDAGQGAGRESRRRTERDWQRVASDAIRASAGLSAGVRASGGLVAAAGAGGAVAADNRQWPCPGRGQPGWPAGWLIRMRRWWGLWRRMRPPGR